VAIVRTDPAHGIAAAVAAFRNEDLPSEVVERVKGAILDTVGIVIAGSGLGEGSRTMAEMVIREGGVGESTVLGRGIKVPCRAAALVNAGFAHALDYDDVFSPARVHPDAICVPAALAVAERTPGTTGADLIAAVALGDEMAIRLGLAIFNVGGKATGSGWPGRLWHPTLLAGYFSSTVASSRLLRLDAGAILNAFGIVLYRTAGTLAYVKGARNLVAELYYGFPSEVGVMSALMAANGITGPKDAFEGEGGLFPAFLGGEYDRDSLEGGFGHEFELLQIETKPWPAVRTSHSYIQAALSLVRAGNIQPAQIEEIKIHCGALALLASEPLALRRRPATAIDAKFSIPFVVSVALAHGSVTISDFLPSNLADPAILSLADRVKIHHAPELDGTGGYRGAGMVRAVIDLRTKDGKIHSESAEYARGGPQDPMTADELVAKFKDCVRYGAISIDGAKADRVIQLIDSLEAQPDLRELFSLLGSPT